MNAREFTSTESGFPSAQHDRTLLGPYRVLDIADERGALCGSMLAAMGADVIKIEPPQGSSMRHLAPFYKDQPGVENSLVWWALNRNKRSITLDIAAPEGADLFRRLVQKADFLVESFKPGHLDGLGLGYKALRQINPRLIFVSITPYGQTGPHSGCEASDINIQGMGGHMYLTGDAERSPVRVGLPASYWHGGSEAAAAAMIAHQYRRRTGRGQHVDVSMQQCVIWTLLNTTMTWQLVRRQEMRGGAVRKERGNTVYTRLVWQCKDGLIYFVPIGGGGGKSRAKSYLRFVQWMKNNGYDDPVLTAKDWNHLDMFNFTQDEYDAVAASIARFLATKTVAEIYADAVRERLLLAPIATVKDLLASPQLKDRRFFIDVEHPELSERFSYPAAFAKFSRTPLVAPRRAPYLGEHNNEILGGELGLDLGQISAMHATAGAEA